MAVASTGESVAEISLQNLGGYRVRAFMKFDLPNLGGPCAIHSALLHIECDFDVGGTLNVTPYCSADVDWTEASTCLTMQALSMGSATSEPQPVDAVGAYSFDVLAGLGFWDGSAASQCTVELSSGIGGEMQADPNSLYLSNGTMSIVKRFVLPDLGNGPFITFDYTPFVAGIFALDGGAFD